DRNAVPLASATEAGVWLRSRAKTAAVVRSAPEISLRKQHSDFMSQIIFNSQLMECDVSDEFSPSLPDSDTRKKLDKAAEIITGHLDKALQDCLAAGL